MICWMPLGCPGRHIIMSSAEPTKSKNETPIYRLKLFPFSTRTGRKRYGVRRVHRELLNRGFLVNHKRVQRIMNQFALCGKRPKEKYHSYKGDVGKVADNIINRDFSTEKPLQK